MLALGARACAGTGACQVLVLVPVLVLALELALELELAPVHSSVGSCIQRCCLQRDSGTRYIATV